VIALTYRSRAALAALFLLVLALVGGVPSTARDATAVERAALDKTIADFDAMMREKRYAETIDTVPAKLIDLISKQANITSEQLRAIMREQVAATFKSVEIESFSFDKQKTEVKALPNGTPYGLIPTTTVVKTQGLRMRSVDQTVALLDGGKWYLVRVSAPQQSQLLKVAYPEFQNVEIAAPVVERLPVN
jgi:hypothetical protein